MKKALFFALCILLFSTFTITVHANSSWWWHTVRPFYLLPIIAAFTIAFESFVIYRYGISKSREKLISKDFLVLTVGAANLASFLLPHFIMTIALMVEMEVNIDQAFYMHTARLPTFVIGIWFLIMTLVCEMPILYFVLRKFSDSRKKLIICIITSNIVTTAVSAVLERTISKGSW